MREALEKAMIEYDQGIVKEKSSLKEFTSKYIIEGDPNLTPKEYFDKIYSILHNFLDYHRNIKFTIIFVCSMEQQVTNKTGIIGF